MRKRKYSLCIVLLIVVLMVLTSCKGTPLTGNTYNQSESIDSQSENAEEVNSQFDTEQECEQTREVVFYNKKYVNYHLGVLITHNHMNSLYEVSSDDNQLYAFRVVVECNKDGGKGSYTKEEIVHLLLEEGLYIVKDYPEDKIIVAGTMEELQRVFNEKDNLGGWCLCASVAMRPDKEPEEEGDKQVTLTVPVILPEEVEQ